MEAGKEVVEVGTVGIQTTIDKEIDHTNEFMFVDEDGSVLTHSKGCVIYEFKVLVITVLGIELRSKR